MENLVVLGWMFIALISACISLYFQEDKIWYWYFAFFAVLFMSISIFFSLPVHAETDVDVDVTPVFENSAWYDTDTADDVVETETVEPESVETETEENNTFTDTAIDVLGNTLTENFNYDRFNSICLGLILVICLFIFMR